MEPRERDWKAHSMKSQVHTGEATLTQQHYAEEQDINNIVRRFGLTGSLPDAHRIGQAVYGDFTGINSYEEALATIERTEGRFMQLPANIREHYQNDPRLLVKAAEGMSEEEFVAMFAAPEEPRAAVMPPVPAPVPPVVET